MRQLSPKRAGRGRGSVSLIIISIGSVSFQHYQVFKAQNRTVYSLNCAFFMDSHKYARNEIRNAQDLSLMITNVGAKEKLLPRFYKCKAYLCFYVTVH